VALACARNALSLHKEATLLLTNGYRARAFALGVIADEELAKALLYNAAAAVGKDRLPHFDRVVTTHKPKQGLAHFTARLVPPINRAVQEAYRLGILEARGELDTGGIPAKEYAIAKAIDRIGTAPDRQLRDFILEPNIQELKNRALYVDHSTSGNVAVPEESAPAAGDLKDYLESIYTRGTVISFYLTKLDTRDMDEGLKASICKAWSEMLVTHRITR
jgi:AbiV family abortive infection protein